MKNINLLPPNLRITRYGSDFSRKLFIGCLLIPAAALLIIVGITRFYQYQYQRHVEESSDSALKGLSESETPARLSRPDKAVTTPDAEPKPLSSTVKSAGDLEQLKPAGESTPLPSAVPIVSIPIEPEHVEGYILRFGLFIEAGKAEAMAKTLKLRGIRVFQQVHQEERDVYTVFQDGYTTYEEGLIEARRLEKDRFPAKVEFYEQGVRVKVESFLAHSNAKEMADRLKARGYPARIIKEFIPLTVYQIKSGPFPTYREAKETQLDLERAGINSIILFKEKRV